MRAAIAALVALAACDAASPDPGSAAFLQVAGAQYAPGEPPADDGGPEVVAVLTTHARIAPGDAREPVRGTLDADARGVILWLEGDLGHWLAPAQAPDAEDRERPTFERRLAFAADLPPGPIALRVQAVDAAGRVGPPRAATYVADEFEPPAGELVVELGWAGVADLDLHVVDPDGVEIWSGNPNSYVPPPPGTPAPPDAWMDGARLDLDANAGCTGGGRPRERVTWTLPPAEGGYVVRVDTRAMCGAALADWWIVAYRAGEPFATARGQSTEVDTRFAHGEGAGLTALTFEQPEG
jgi:hypothetical protein